MNPAQERVFVRFVFAERRVHSEARMVGAVLLDFLDGMTKRAEGLGSVMATGIERLDQMINGSLRPGQLPEKPLPF